TGGQLLFQGGTNTINVDSIKVAGTTYMTITPSINVASAIGQATTNAVSITKTGDGLLQLSGTGSTFTGGVTLTAGTLGGLVIGGTPPPPTAAAAGAGATPITSGPLGTGVLTVGAGQTILVDNASRTVANSVVFQDNTLLFDNTNIGTNATLTFNSA